LDPPDWHKLAKATNPSNAGRGENLLGSEANQTPKTNALKE